MLAVAQIISLLSRSLALTAMVLLVTMTAGLVMLHLHGDKLLSVQTASMVPAFRPGDALVVAPVSKTSLHVGEVISYRSPQNPQIVISHRLVHLDLKRDMLMTAGDALRTEDQPFSQSAIAGKVVAIMPNFGTTLDTLRKPWVLVPAIFVPAIIFLYGEIMRLLAYLARPRYQVADYKANRGV